jgi:thymidylate synthase
MNNIDKQYQALLQDILDNGTPKSDRTGTGTISVFGRQIRHDMKDGFPLLTTKKMPFKTIVTELLWFLRGDTNIKYLVDNNCHIWDGDAYKNYLKWFNEQSKVFVEQGIVREPWTKEQYIEQIKLGNVDSDLSDLGPIYGKQWRSWGKRNHDSISNEYFIGIDQIQNLINDLKTNPDSRRLMVNAWNVGELDQMVLPPCHYGFQVYTRELSLEERRKLAKYDSEFVSPMTVESWDRNNIPTRAISLMWNQRSVDTFLGLPFNIASYGLLLEIIAKEVNMVPDELIGNLGDVHLYSNHIEQAKEQIGRELSLSERREMVTQEMFNQIYNAGGPETLSHSEIDQWDIPRIKTREPFPLPKLVFNPIFLANLEHNSFDEAINGQINFELDDYQSHPAIKAPLSN